MSPLSTAVHSILYSYFAPIPIMCLFVIERLYQSQFRAPFKPCLELVCLLLYKLRAYFMSIAQTKRLPSYYVTRLRPKLTFMCPIIAS